MWPIIISFGIKIFSALIGLLTTVLIARAFDKSSAGEVFWFLSVLAVLASVSKLGFESPIVRRVAGSLNRPAEISQLFSVQLKISIIASIVVSLLAGTIVFILGGLAFGSYSEIAIVALGVALIFESVFACSSRFIQGSGRPYLFLMIGSIQKLFFLATFSITYYFYDISTEMLLLMFFSSYVPSLIILWFAIQRIFPAINIDFRRGREESISLIKESLPLLGVAVASMLAQHLSIFMIQIMNDTASVAEYSVSFRIVSMIGFLLIAANTVASPIVAQSFQEKGIDGAYTVYRAFTKKVIVLCLPIVVVLFLLGGPLLSLFGPGYESAYGLLAIMLVGQMFNIATGIVVVLYIMTKHSKVYRNISVSINLTGIIIGPVLIYVYGIMGAAIAYSLIMSASNIVMHYYFKYRILKSE